MKKLRKKMKKTVAFFLAAVLMFATVDTGILSVSAENTENGTEIAAETESGLCEHHTEHTEECYNPVINCVHVHTAECYPEGSVSGNDAMPSETEPTECTHVCSEESGCMTKELNCQYVCHVCEVQELIDTLPALSDMESMGDDEREAAIVQYTEAYEAYEALSDEEKAQVTGAEMFKEFLTLMNVGVPLAETAGAFTIEGGTEGMDYSYTAPTTDENGALQTNGYRTILTGTSLTISTSGTSSDYIVINSGVTANITLNDVTIQPGTTKGEESEHPGDSAIEVKSGAKLNLVLSGTNTLTGGNYEIWGIGYEGGPYEKLNDYSGAGIHVPSSASLEIGGNGSLVATAGADGIFASGIGATYYEASGTITINSGTVTAIASHYNAGIGGGGNYAVGNITINGGTVTATSKSSGAGIGGGLGGAGGTITINGGTVTATSESGGAGIGGGSGGAVGTVTINNGTVTAKSGAYGAGIGSGSGADQNTGSVTIRGGIVTAEGGAAGAGIGGGQGGYFGGAGCTVVITGGIVTATGGGAYGGYNGAGIGAGGGTADHGSFATSDDEVSPGTAIIYATGGTLGDSPAAAIGDNDTTTGWSGIIFEGSNGTVYGNQTLTDDFEIKSGQTLTVPAGSSLTVPQGITLTVNGTLNVESSGTFTNNGSITGSGTISGSVKGNGSIGGEITFTAGAFIVSGGVLDTDFSYADGVLTILTDKELTISNTDSSTSTTDRIVIGNDVTANLTLAGVNIAAPEGKSAIDVPSGASLNITLEEGSQNTLTGGDGLNAYSTTGTYYCAGSGIHLPTGADLTIGGTGALTVYGGNGNIDSAYGGTGIGGYSGGSGYTTSVESGGDVTINGGTISITGGTGYSSGPGGAGIGGGSGKLGGTGGTVIINDGVVAITGGSSGYIGGAGIGGGSALGAYSAGAGGTVIITGGSGEIRGGTGTASINTVGGAGIGGGAGGSTSATGGAGATVVILTDDFTIAGGKGVQLGNDIGGGIGLYNASIGGNKTGATGDGIKPGDTTNAYVVYGDLTLPTDVTTYTIPQGVTVNVPADASLTIPAGVELIVNGTLSVEGTLTNNGTLKGDGTLKGSGTFTGKGTNDITKNVFATNISVSISKDNVSVDSANIGDTVTLKAEVTNGIGENITDGTVTFYKGTQEDGKALNDNGATVSGGKAEYTLILNIEDWSASSSPYTITAVYTAAEGSSQATARKETTLTVGKSNSSVVAAAYKGETVNDTFNYGDTITIKGKISGGSGGQVVLYLGAIQLSGGVDVGSDDNFTLTYDTGNQDIPIGDYQTLEVIYGGNDNLTEGSTTVSIKLYPKSVTAIVDKDITKLYDGTNGATVSLSVDASDLVNSTDKITVTGSGTYASADVADSISVTVDNIQTSGDDAGWYSVNAPAGVTGNITEYTVNKDDAYTVNNSGWITGGDFEITAKDGYSLSTTNTSDGDWLNSLTVDEEGTGELTFYVKNKDGAISTAFTEAYKIDRTAPVISASGSTGKYLQSDTVEVTAIAGVSGITSVTVSKDGGTAEDITGSYTSGYTVTSNGTYTFTVTNGAGVSDETSISYDKLDSAQPVVILDTNGYTGDTWTNADVTLSISNSTENLGDTKLLYKVDSGDWSDYTGAITISQDTDADGIKYVFKAVSASGVESEEVSVIVKVDKTAPTGEIKIGDSGWREFLNTITFGLFFKDTQTVSIEPEDALSGVAKVEYISSATALTLEEVKARTDWIEGRSVNVTPEDGKQFIYYARITDNAGNVLYISTDGAEFDLTKPVITELTDGRTYCISVDFTVTDKNLDTVKVDGVEATAVEGVYTLTAGPHTVEVTDKADNVTTVTVTVNAAHTPAADDGDCSTNVICTVCGETTTDAKEHDFSGDYQSDAEGHWHVCTHAGCTVTDTKTAHNGTDDNDCTTAVTCEDCGYEITAAQEHDFSGAWQSDAEGHWHVCAHDGCTVTDTKTAHSGGMATYYAQAVCEVCGAGYGSIKENPLDDVGNITDENLSKDDKEALEDAAAAIEKELEDNRDKYTEEQIAELEEKVQEIKDLIESIEKVEEIEKDITNLPDTVSPDDTEAEKLIDAVKDAYDNLTDKEKDMVSDELKEKLDSLIEQLTDYKIIDGHNSTWGGDGSLVITGNGDFSKFVEVKVQGETLDTEHYTAAAGSTIITLKETYLSTLAPGTYTFEIVWTDGSAATTFIIGEKAPEATVTEEPTTEQPTEAPAATTEDTDAEGPGTGDTAVPEILLAAIILSVSAMIICLIRYRKQKKS